MDKRYQVFVSSTYADLKEERQKVIQTLMEMDCIPAGMELFPATDEEQFEFIKKIIDDCDYYLLIIGGRYGSVSEQGVSYTEKEFDYAKEKGLKIIAFVHGDPASISVGKTDNNPLLAERLDVFRNKAQQSRLVKYWKTPEELPGMVSLSLSKTIKTYPAVGWVRANAVSSTELLEQLNELRLENERLRSISISSPQHQLIEVPEIAEMSEWMELIGTYFDEEGNERIWRQMMTWREIFRAISPHLLAIPVDATVENALGKAAFSKSDSAHGSYFSIADDSFQTVKIQLRMLGLVELKPTEAKNSRDLLWYLTSRGEYEMVQSRVVRTAFANPT